jgi:hypothetical protein
MSTQTVLIYNTLFAGSDGHDDRRAHGQVGLKVAP